jgi:hypothetical protein
MLRREVGRGADEGCGVGRREGKTAGVCDYLETLTLQYETKAIFQKCTNFKNNFQKYITFEIFYSSILNGFGVMDINVTSRAKQGPFAKGVLQNDCRQLL